MTFDSTLAGALERRWGSLSAEALLVTVIEREFPGRVALVSSFGIEAAVLLHMVALIGPRTPVLFIDTGQLFPETLAYRDALVRRLGLTDVRRIAPDAAALAEQDPEGMLWRSNPDACCNLRKVAPLERALAGFDAWINGRKRAHGGTRAALPLFEAVDGRIKINPLADWDAGRVDGYFTAHELARHPMQAHGYASIGCMPCSDRTRPGDGPRDGRWRGRTKTECGIHLPRGQG